MKIVKTKDARVTLHAANDLYDGPVVIKPHAISKGPKKAQAKQK